MNRKEPLLTNIGFCLGGIMASFANIIGISAAVDIVAAEFPKSIVLFCDIIPGFVLTFLYPFVMQHVKMVPLTIAITLIGILGFILGGLSTVSTVLGLLGVVCFSLQTGIEAPFLGLSGDFYEDTSASFSIGLGIAGLLGSGGYVLLTETLGIDYSIIMYSFVPIPLLLLVALWMIRIKPSQKKLDASVATEAKIDENQLMGDLEKVALAADVPTIAETTASDAYQVSASAITKWQVFKQNYVAMVSLLVTYLTEYTITSGINPTLIFNGDEKAYYKYAAFAIRIGNLLGRLSVKLFEVPYFSLAIFGALTVGFFILYTFQSVYRYITSIYVMLAVGPFLGICSGVNYANTMFHMQKRIGNAKMRAFALSLSSLMANIGAAAATFLGTGMEIWLKKVWWEDWDDST